MIVQLTPEQVTYFGSMEELFATSGWKLFHEDMVLRKDELLKSALYFSSHESFLTAKGRLQSLDQVIDFENMVDALKRGIEEADEQS